MNKTKLKGNLILLLTAFIWGTSFIAQSVGVELVSPFAFIGFRSLLGGIVLLPVILIMSLSKKDKPEEDKKSLIIGGVLCGVFLCLASNLQTMGMVHTSPGKAGFITALYMVLIPIAGLFMGKKPRLIILLSVLLATVGLYLMCISESFTINKGDVMIFVCAFLFTGHILVIDHFSPKCDGVKLSCIQFFVCGIINMIYVLLFEGVNIASAWDSRMSIAYSGILSCGVAYTLQIVGQKYTDPTSASILMSLESVFATLSTVVLVALGWNLTGGVMTEREIWGCVMMFVAIILVQLPEKKKS
ncbi:MAG: DMT family transporter [Clostridia bacterium]|nr:DMT family transporter [Clostridia bacterium]